MRKNIALVGGRPSLIYSIGEVPSPFGFPSFEPLVYAAEVSMLCNIPALMRGKPIW